MNKPYFVTKPEIRNYFVQGKSIDIEVNENVFPPPIENSISSKNILIKKNETVIDIGTGSGLLAILAAKLGGKVVATDISQDAINLANENAFFNDVNIKFETGKYFSTYKNTFDVIIANLSQTLIPPEYRKSDKIIKSIDGGNHGNQNVLELLKIANNHMHSKSRMYINVYTISYYKETLELMKDKYKIKLIAKQSEEVKPIIIDNLKFYQSLNNTGKIRIFRNIDETKWMAQQILYELRLK